MATKPVIQAIEAGNNMVEESNYSLAIESDNVPEIREINHRIKKLSETEHNKNGKNGRE